MSRAKELLDAATPLPWHYGGPDYPDGDMMFLCGPPGGPAVIASSDASLRVEADLKLAAYAVNRLPDYEALLNAFDDMGSQWEIDWPTAEAALARLRDETSA